MQQVFLWPLGSCHASACPPGRYLQTPLNIYSVTGVSAPHNSDIMISTHKLEHVPVKYIVVREALSVEEGATKIQVGGKLSCDKEKTFLGVID
uniref:Uncharacterized protein n=1 Tax=Dicentrarchus labrax TaxID=13489 RepID=A0A8C4H5M9_DICLA